MSDPKHLPESTPDLIASMGREEFDRMLAELKADLAEQTRLSCERTLDILYPELRWWRNGPPPGRQERIERLRAAQLEEEGEPPKSPPPAD